jgi:hypothetical protein
MRRAMYTLMYGFLRCSNTSANVFNNANLGKQPVVIQKGKLEGVELRAMVTAALRAVDMGYNDPAVDDPGKPLEAFMNLLIAENLLRGLFHQSLIFAKKTDTPSVHVFTALFSENGQIIFGCIVIARRDGQYVTHDRLRFAINHSQNNIGQNNSLILWFCRSLFCIIDLG